MIKVALLTREWKVIPHAKHIEKKLLKMYMSSDHYYISHDNTHLEYDTSLSTIKDFYEQQLKIHNKHHSP